MDMKVDEKAEAEAEDCATVRSKYDGTPYFCTQLVNLALGHTYLPLSPQLF